MRGPDGGRLCRIPQGATTVGHPFGRGPASPARWTRATAGMDARFFLRAGSEIVVSSSGACDRGGGKSHGGRDPSDSGAVPANGRPRHSTAAADERRPPRNDMCLLQRLEARHGSKRLGSRSRPALRISTLVASASVFVSAPCWSQTLDSTLWVTNATPAQTSARSVRLGVSGNAGANRARAGGIVLEGSY